MKDDLLKNSLIDYWKDLAFKLFENDIKGSVQERMAGIKLYTQAWIFYPLTQTALEQHKTQSFLFCLKKASRDHSIVMRYFSFESLFRLLDSMA